MFEDCQNCAGSWGLYFMGDCFVDNSLLSCQTITWSCNNSKTTTRAMALYSDIGSAKIANKLESTY